MVFLAGGVILKDVSRFSNDLSQLFGAFHGSVFYMREIAFVTANFNLLSLGNCISSESSRTTMVAFRPQWQMVLISTRLSAQANKHLLPSNSSP